MGAEGMVPRSEKVTAKRCPVRKLLQRFCGTFLLLVCRNWFRPVYSSRLGFWLCWHRPQSVGVHWSSRYCCPQFSAYLSCAALKVLQMSMLAIPSLVFLAYSVIWTFHYSKHNCRSFCTHFRRT